MTKLQLKKTLLLTSLGGLLEFYDFIIYALLAGVLSPLFFPNTSGINSILLVFGAYAIGYFARPFGGIIFGHFGDKYGRKKTFTISILVMAASTFLIGLLPTYQTAGTMAPILLIICRIGQGLSVGGEIPEAITYISEVAPTKRGLMTSKVFCFLISGVDLGYIIKALMIILFSQQQILSWAWRLPFFLGGAFGFIAYYLRCKLTDIQDFQPFIKQEFAIPLTKLVRTSLWQVIYSSIIISFGALVFVTLFILLPTYITNFTTIHIEQLAWINSSGVLILAFSCIIVGIIADKVSRTKILIINILLTIVLSFAIYAIYIHYQHIYFVAIILSAILAALSWGNIPAILTILFPMDTRYSGIGLSYNIGFAIFGGLTPLIVLSAMKFSDNLMAPAYVLSSGAIITLITIYLNKLITKKK